MKNSNEPDPQFVEHLEWQIRREFRRQQRFAPAPSVWRVHGWRVAALIVVSLLVGYAGATAAQDASGRRQRQLLELESRARLEIAEVQLQQAEEQLGVMASRQSAGVVSARDAERMLLERQFMELAVARMRLEAEELRASGRPPRNDLAAPEIDGRDFVSERLKLELEEMSARIRAEANNTRELEEHVRVGAAPARELELMLMQRRQIDAREQMLRRSLRARHEFLDGVLSAEEVAGQQALMEARLSSEVADIAVDISHRRIAEAPVEQMSPTDLSALRAQLQMAEIQSEMARLRLQLLRAEYGNEGEPD